MCVTRIRFSLSTRLLVLTGCVIACIQPAAMSKDNAAEQVYLNAAIYTVDANRSWAEAVAIADGRIVFVGSNAQVQRWIGEATEIVDLDGKMMLPGFHDAHTHMLINWGMSSYCDLSESLTEAAVEAAARRCAALEGHADDGWITGGEWLGFLWGTRGPGKEILDEAFPDRPVILWNSFGHSAWVNSRALEIAGINLQTPNPPGGVIVRNPETGEATGMLHDAAVWLVSSKIPPFPLDESIDYIKWEIARAHSIGVTAVIEPGVAANEIGPILAVADAGDFDLRATLSLSPISWRPGAFDDGIYELLARREAWRRPNIDVDSVKIYMDGIIEAGTGATLEPYKDESFGRGVLFYLQEQVDRIFSRLDAMGVQIHVHALGDAGVRRALDGFEAMRDANGVSGNRHHITHLQLIDEADYVRFGELNVGATFQALWAYPDPTGMDHTLAMLGAERANKMYPLGSVHRAGGRLVGSSDYSVTDMNPLLAIEVGVTRQDPYADGGPTLNAKERVDLATMIAAYTINGAYTMGLDEVQGSIEVGKRADLVILDRNLFEIKPDEISDVLVERTIFDGRVVYPRRD